MAEDTHDTLQERLAEIRAKEAECLKRHPEAEKEWDLQWRAYGVGLDWDENTTEADVVAAEKAWELDMGRIAREPMPSVAEREDAFEEFMDYWRKMRRK